MEKQERILRNQLGHSWYEKIGKRIQSEEGKAILDAVELSRSERDISPREEYMYNAFRLCSFEDTKVVIIGEMPSKYSFLTDGLAFSSDDPFEWHEGQKTIFEEIDRDLYEGSEIFRERSLSKWSVQGVLLLNLFLTADTEDRKAHTKLGWQKITIDAIKMLARDSTPKVFMAWGATAKKVMSMVSAEIKHKHLVVAAASPIVAEEKGGEGFIGSNNFSECNEFLNRNHYMEINW